MRDQDRESAAAARRVLEQAVLDHSLAELAAAIREARAEASALFLLAWEPTVRDLVEVQAVAVRLVEAAQRAQDAALVASGMIVHSRHPGGERSPADTAPAREARECPPSPESS